MGTSVSLKSLKSINLPTTFLKLQPQIADTLTQDIKSFGTPSVSIVVTGQKWEYDDVQFYADLKKASKRLDSMVKQALKEDAEGKTREFPM